MFLATGGSGIVCSLVKDSEGKTDHIGRQGDRGRIAARASGCGDMRGSITSGEVDFPPLDPNNRERLRETKDEVPSRIRDVSEAKEANDCDDEVP